MIAGERVLISVFDCMCIFLESVMTTIFRGKSIEYRIFNVRIQEFHEKYHANSIWNAVAMDPVKLLRFPCVSSEVLSPAFLLLLFFLALHTSSSPRHCMNSSGLMLVLLLVADSDILSN